MCKSKQQSKHLESTSFWLVAFPVHHRMFAALWAEDDLCVSQQRRWYWSRTSWTLYSDREVYPLGTTHGLRRMVIELVLFLRHRNINRQKSRERYPVCNFKIILLLLCNMRGNKEGINSWSETVYLRQQLRHR